MNKTVHSIVTCLVLIGLGWTLWIGVRKQKEKPATEEAAAEKPAEGAAKEEEKPEAFVVKLEKEKWQALDIEKGEPEKAELQPQKIAFGRVLDPTPIVTLDGDLAAAEAALSASRAENERTQKLLAAGENTSRKAAETAEAQFRADEIKADGLRRRALIEWGPSLPELDAAKRREFVEQLVRGEAALVRVDILPGDALAEQPKSARLLVLGREEQVVETPSITPAADVDPKTQAQGFILRVDQPPFPLRPGMALTAWLQLPEKPRIGFAIPRSAVLRHDGRTWVYVQEDEENFVRKPVTLDTPLDGNRGWFVAEGGGIQAGDLLVVTGAQSLLSEELKAQGGGEPD
ncbi:MAG: hypothetical protein QOE70_6264 [Chthoniobacter sp.]|jgi:hypothetical protein|nr:hypothetical protein [Chthoniobacter sp.]